MPVAKGTVFACSECGGAGHTRVGCPEVLATLYPIGSMVGEHSTVVALEAKAVRLRCKCGAEFVRRHGEINRDEREGFRVTCGAWRCRCTRRAGSLQWQSREERRASNVG